MLRSIYQSPALRAAAVFGISGAAFAIGNLILARVLSSYEFGLVSLVIGVISVTGPSAPLGLDFLIVRRGLAFGPGLRRTALFTSVLIGLASLLAAAALYRLQLPLLLAVFVATVATGISQSVAAHFQSRRQFAISVPFMQASNWAVMLIGIIAAICGITTATLPSALLALAGLITATVGWLIVARVTVGGDRMPAPANLWSEAIPLMAMNVAGSVLLQLERLIVPMTTGIEDLALFGVAAALVGSPFRMLQMAISFTVIPRLRDASSVEDRRRLLRREFLLFAIIMGPASVVIWLVAPPIAHWFLGGRYDLTSAIIIAMVVSGVLKVLSAFGTSVVSALAPGKGLRLLSAASWACIALAVILAFALRSGGLCGVIYAISIGWLARSVVAFWISVPHLQRSKHMPPI